MSVQPNTSSVQLPARLMSAFDIPPHDISHLFPIFSQKGPGERKKNFFFPSRNLFYFMYCSFHYLTWKMNRWKWKKCTCFLSIIVSALITSCIKHTCPIMPWEIIVLNNCQVTNHNLGNTLTRIIGYKEYNQMGWADQEWGRGGVRRTWACNTSFHVIHKTRCVRVHLGTTVAYNDGVLSCK